MSQSFASISPSLNRYYFQEPAELGAAVVKAVRETEVVLDIGCGIAPMNYFRPKLHVMVEPWKEYSDILAYRHQGDKSVMILRTGGLEALQLLADQSVDSIFLLDVIEHLEKEEGIKLIAESERVAREQIVIFTPLGFMPQHMESGEKDGWGLGGGTVQEHRSGWEPEDFSEAWSFYICETFHAHDYKNEPLETPYGAFYAIRNFEHRTLAVPYAMSDYRKPLPAELEAQRLQGELGALRAEYQRLYHSRSMRVLRKIRRVLQLLRVY